MTNQEIAELLRSVAAAYQILDENRFKIIAYERAADGIEHLTSDLKDLWDDGKLSEIPGVGQGIASSLDELFRTGHVRHFTEVLGRLPSSIFPLLLVPGIGPKKAYRLVKELDLTDPKTVVSDLEKAAKAGKIAPMDGFGQKSQELILANIETFRKGAIKENRMSLPDANSVANDVLEHLRKHKAVLRADPLGSLRRRVSTIGDIDISACTNDPEAVINHFLTYPHQKLTDRGVAGSTILLHNGRQVDLRVQRPDSYGAMLQYFTGSKHHNIQLRTFALEKGLSLNEHGIKHVKTGTLTKVATEEEFYKTLHLPYIPPELREDKGEIDAARNGKLPRLIELADIRGDLHIHTDYSFPSSHDLGASDVLEHLNKAAESGYAYIGVSDHNPSITNQGKDKIISVMKARKEYYEHKYSSWTKSVQQGKTSLPAGRQVHLFVMCEVDILPDGKLALPDEAFEYVDAVVVSIHSSFTQPRPIITKRIITALTGHPKVRIFGHPTGRLLSRREGVDADWQEVFDVCKERSIAMEVNSYPDRLDLPDSLVFDAVKKGVKLCIDTDSHAVQHMDLMEYGISVARRGWATKRDIVNSLDYNEFAAWLIKGG